MIKQAALESSMLLRGAYEPATQLLYLQFRSNGKVYVYKDVDRTVWQELTTASSHGKYFLAAIKTRYACEQFDSVAFQTMVLACTSAMLVFDWDSIVPLVEFSPA